MGGRRRSRLLVVVVFLVFTGCAALVSRPGDPLSAEEHNDLGVAYQARGELDLAIRQYQRALALRPGWSRPLLNLGNVYLEQGRIAEAIASYEQALAAAPDDPVVLNNLAWALLQHPTRWPEAEPLTRRALAQNPNPRPPYLDTLGMVSLKKGQTAQALAIFREALQDPALARDPRTRSRILLHAGDAHRALGNEEGAGGCYRQALALDPTGPGGRTARERLGDPAQNEVGAAAGVC